MWEREIKGLPERKKDKRRVMPKITEILSSCSFSWEKLKEMKDNEIEFWAADGLNKLRIFEIDEREKSFYVVNQLGKRTWPFRFKKLERLHKQFHDGEITLLPYEMDKLVPTWGNYIAGLLKYLGCDK